MDLLCRGHILDQVRVIEGAHSVDDFSVADALVEIASCLYAARHMGWDTPSLGDLDIIDEVLAAISSISDALVERFALPAVYVTRASGHHVNQRRRTGASVQLTWRPADRLWTAPLVEPSSAWAFWDELTTNRAWTRQLRFESPGRESRVVVESLADSDELIGQNSFRTFARHLQDTGIKRIDFSWRCVLEAECSVLRGERDATSYPCSLGTECSVWLISPVPTSELQEDSTLPDDPDVEPGWFTYG